MTELNMETDIEGKTLGDKWIETLLFGSFLIGLATWKKSIYLSGIKTGVIIGIDIGYSHANYDIGQKHHVNLSIEDLYKNKEKLIKEVTDIGLPYL